MEKDRTENLVIRACTPADLDAIMTLQQHICDTMTQPDLFVPTCRAQNADFLTAPNAIFGVFDDARLVAYGSLVFPNDDPDNLGWDLGWTRETVCHCATLDTIVVDPQYRGLHLQRRLIQTCVAYAREVLPGCRILTTISPYNEFSLRNGLSEGFQIQKRLIKYGGKERYILGDIQDPDYVYPAFVPGASAVVLQVEPILQNPELPTGCESVALTMVLNYCGYHLAKTDIADHYLEKDPQNFVTKFKGDPYDPDGDGIYAPGLTKTAARFLAEHGSEKTACDLTGAELPELYRYLDQSIPVIVYDSVYLHTPVAVADYTVDGRTWQFWHNEHCLVLCGYDPEHHMVLLSDSLSGLVWREEATFRRIYDMLGKMAVVIE